MLVLFVTGTAWIPILIAGVVLAFGTERPAAAGVDER